MIPTTDYRASLAQHRQEQKHRAFTRWRASGYADMSAWREFVALFEIAAVEGRRAKPLTVTPE